MSASDCWAVGYYYGRGALQTLIVHWDGISWDIVSSPSAGLLLDVTCVSASDCWAVGYTTDIEGRPNQTVIEHWDGTSWSVVSSPSISSALLSGVTCISASECWAVGYFADPFGLTSINQTLVERWDGTSWAIVSSPNIPTRNNLLLDVTCASVSNCWAVGYYSNGSSFQTLIERWDGASWTLAISPNTNSMQDNILTGVTCASASNCWAVGYYFNDVSGATQTLIERWNGTLWTIVASPNTSTTQGNVLYGISCASASDCWAVGYYYGSNGYQTLIERWDGTSWALITSPNTSATQSNYLYGVTCTSASTCWAVGYYYGSNGYQTLSARWDGTSWAIVLSPNTFLAQHNFLSGVTCISASDCWAVGYYYGSSAIHTLIERWDGTSWTIVTSPNTSTTQTNYLFGVTCVSASDCWAVGFANSGIGTTLQTLIERWDGSSWTIVTSPNTSTTQHNFLFGVTCASASDCWAVGKYDRGVAVPTLIERWDGTSWVIVPSPNTGASNSDILNGVTCASALDCWAVGNYWTGSARQTLIERWDGTAWAIVSSPNTSPTQYNFLLGVTCVSASDCWAVGYTSNVGSTTFQTLIERWDGTSWAIVSSPNASATQNDRLLGVTCVSASECWAVGYYYSGAVAQTLIERYTAISPLTPTSVVSRKTHDTAGNFDIDLPLAGNPGIECRTGGTNNEYQMLVTFAKAVTFNSAAVTSGTGTISSTTGSGTTALTVNLTSVTNAQTLTVTLIGVNDGTNTGDVAVRIGVLLGDTTANRAVNSSDIAQTKSKSGQVVTSANFRQDVTISGSINSSDISLVKSKSGTGLP